MQFRIFKQHLRDVEFCQSQRTLNTDYPRILRFRETDGVQCHFDRFAVGIVVERDFRLLRPKRGDTVHIGRVPINLLYKTGRCKIGKTDTRGVAIALFSKIPDEYTEDRGFRRFRFEILHHPTDDVRIHTGTADIFACPIHDQQIKFIERESPHQRFRLNEQFTFVLKKVRGGHRYGFRGIFVCVLN